MNGLTAADYADTGQWRLIVNIFPTGITAHLENTIHTDLEPQLLFSTEWEEDADTLLRHIENAVYDHPRVLDDFTARIIVHDRNTLFMPTAVMEENEGIDEIFYTTVFETDPADVMTDTFGDITALYSPTPGLKAFLSRTFPGAMVESALMRRVRRFRKEDGKRIYISVRKGEADFLLFDGEEFLSGSTHGVNAPSDVVYHAVNIIDVCDLVPADVSVMIEGEENVGEVCSLLERIVASVNVNTENKRR